MASIPVIGVGAVCCAGYGVEEAWPAVCNARNGLEPITLFDTQLKEVPLVGQITTPPEDKLGCKVPNRTTGLAIWAAREALKGVDTNGLKVGVVLATTVAGITRSELFYREYRKNPDHARHAARELADHEPTATTGAVARDINATGFHTVSTACSTGLHAIGMAKRLVEKNFYDLCIAVGTDALSLLTVRGFASLMLIDFSGCKPFDKRRVGISLGEGAGALALASDHVAQRLGISPSVRVAGWGATADCHHMTAPHPEGAGAKAAVTAALKEAGLSPADIGYIAAHGTATPDNDVAEIRAMKSIFGALPPFGSMKGTLGHTLAASGTLEAVFAAHAMKTGTLPGSANFEELDDDIGVAPADSQKADVSHILKNSFGFGGNNATIILSKA